MWLPLSYLQQRKNENPILLLVFIFVLRLVVFPYFNLSDLRHRIGSKVRSVTVYNHGTCVRYQLQTSYYPSESPWFYLKWRCIKPCVSRYKSRHKWRIGNQVTDPFINPYSESITYRRFIYTWFPILFLTFKVLKFFFLLYSLWVTFVSHKSNWKVLDDCLIKVTCNKDDVL